LLFAARVSFNDSKLVAFVHFVLDELQDHDRAADRLRHGGSSAMRKQAENLHRVADVSPAATEAWLVLTCARESMAEAHRALK
jgi:hypothetical protein